MMSSDDIIGAVVVCTFAYYSNDPNLNPAEVYKMFEKNKISEKEARNGSFIKCYLTTYLSKEFIMLLASVFDTLARSLIG